MADEFPAVGDPTPTSLGYILAALIASSGGGGGGGSVASVFGRTGAVAAQTGDYTAAQVGADASGAAATAQTTAETFATGVGTTERNRAETAEALLAPLISPALTGSPTAPTESPGNNSTDIATTAYADAATAVEKGRASTAEGLLVVKTNNLSDLSNEVTARTNLGLGTAATHAATDFDAAGTSATETTRAETAEALLLVKSSNLSDLANAATARTNLGLGTAATTAATAYDAAGTSATETTRAEAAEALLAPLASPVLTGTPTAVTKGALTNNTDIATTAYADAAVAVELSRAETAEALKAPITSPTFLGTPASVTGTTGDASTQIATDAFVATAVNLAIAGVNPMVAVQAATIAAADTSGYTFAGAGIGATATGPTNNVAAIIDGFTFTVVGQRLLIKNDTQSISGSHDGIYALTVLQTAGTKPIFTRASDFDTTQDVNNTGAVPVANGTVNAGTSWLQTAQVTTMDTTAQVWIQFSYALAAVMQVATYDPGGIAAQVVGLVAAQTLTNKRITRRVQTSAAPGATPSMNTDLYDFIYFTGLNAAITSMTSGLTGTPVAGDRFVVGLTDNATARAITWGASFEPSTVPLPTTTVISALLLVGFVWNTVTSKWRCVAVA